MKNYGLLPTPVDTRDFKLGAITTLPELSKLPKSFRIAGYRIKDQKDTDFCTQFMACGMSELQEGVELSPEWAFAKSKEMEGNIDTYGQDIRSALKVHVKFGVPEADEVPFSVKNKDSEFLRDIKNYPATYSNSKHFKDSYFAVTGQYDHFDNIRATIWKYRYEKRAVASGFVFVWSSSDIIFKDFGQSGSGHAMTYVGWEEIDGEIYLIVANSYGKDAGKDGYHYVSREVVNKSVNIYGAFTFLDMNPETVKYMIENGITDRDNWIIQLYKVVITTAQQIIQRLQEQLPKKK